MNRISEHILCCLSGEKNANFGDNVEHCGSEKDS